MTVRAWFTISALVLVALAAAFAFRLFAPITAPAILVRSGDVRLKGEMLVSCWPQRDGEIDCERGGEQEGISTVPSKGTFRLIVAYPVQPEAGRISIDGNELERSRVVNDWRPRVPYDLEPGIYRLFVDAEYPEDASLSYTFAFRVTRSGS